MREEITKFILNKIIVNREPQHNTFWLFAIQIIIATLNSGHNGNFGNKTIFL